MIKKRKVCVVTGTRAEYGLLQPLISKINRDSELVLQLIVTGMHLSPEFGLTYKEIENDGFKIDKKIEMLMSSDSPIGISKAMGLAQISFSEALDELSPDIVVILGDRFEMLAIASVAMILGVVIAHIGGGQLTLGAVDESFRHAITKMSSLHFTSTEDYKNRVIQLGESSDKVFNVGSLGAENCFNTKLLSKSKLEKILGFKFLKRNLLITFHPETLNVKPSKELFFELLESLRELPDTKLIFTKANADADGRIINQMIDEFVLKNKNAVGFNSLGRVNYLSCLQFVDAIVGNSSSGIIEAPSFKIATINIGDRQKGRVRALQTFDIQINKDEIIDIISKIYRPEFKRNLSDVINPYAKENTSSLILDEIKSADLKRIRVKLFHDIEKIERN
tara:strand:+ start:1505 stop:2683 length:1179 start_codon:yes stop_codon:yes gene_type:complete